MEEASLALSALAIAAVSALNVTVVMNNDATSYVKFDSVGRIFARGSGSASGEVEDSKKNLKRGKQECSDCGSGHKVTNPEGKDEPAEVCTCLGSWGPKDCSPIKCMQCN